MKVAADLIKRIGGEATGAAAVTQFTKLWSKGFPEEMQMLVKGIAKGDAEQPQPEVGTKHQRAEVPTAAEVICVWEKFGTAVPELRDVVIRLLSAHATSAATERNWSLWGRIYVLLQGPARRCRLRGLPSTLQSIAMDQRSVHSPPESNERAYTERFVSVCMCLVLVSCGPPLYSVANCEEGSRRTALLLQRCRNGWQVHFPRWPA